MLDNGQSVCLGPEKDIVTGDEEDEESSAEKDDTEDIHSNPHSDSMSSNVPVQRPTNMPAATTVDSSFSEEGEPQKQSAPAGSREKQGTAELAVKSVLFPLLALASLYAVVKLVAGNLSIANSGNKSKDEEGDGGSNREGREEEHAAAESNDGAKEIEIGESDEV